VIAVEPTTTRAWPENLSHPSASPNSYLASKTSSRVYTTHRKPDETFLDFTRRHDIAILQSFCNQMEDSLVMNIHPFIPITRLYTRAARLA